MLDLKADYAAAILDGKYDEFINQGPQQIFDGVLQLEIKQEFLQAIIESEGLLADAPAPSLGLSEALTE